MSDTRDVVDAWNRKWRLYIGYKAAQAKGRLLKGEQREAFWEAKHSYLAENVWSNIAELRGWWVKVGQFLSTRSDLLPSQYIKHLAKLQDMMPTSDFSVVAKIVEDELGRPLNDVFSEFEEKAIASASIGQVHKARLKETGEYVVVKVQHPGVDRTLKQDMVTLTQMTWAFGLLEKGLNFGPILDEWQKSAADELDFRLELGYQERARQAAIAANLDVIIPKCYPEYTTKRILVMEFCEGFKITDTKQLEAHHVDVDELMVKICRAFAHQIHVDGLFNGDPHPGNILVQVDRQTGTAHPVLLDWGLVKSFTPSAKIAFASAVYSVANMDVMGLMAAFEDMGFRFKSDSPIDPELYMDALRIGFFRDTGETVSVAEKEAASVAIKNSKISKKDVMRQNPIDDWPKDIIFFVRVASLLHGLSLQLKAKVPFLQILVEKAEQCLCERFIPPSPSVYFRYPAAPGGKVRCPLEWKVARLLRYLLEDRRLLLGCQVAVYKDRRLIVDTCVGKMGPTNSRPVSRDSLFCTMTATTGILATALLKLVDEKELSLDDLVCHWWDGFIRFGKQHITVRDVLTHKAGLHRALPKDLKLSQLMDYEAMVSILEDARPVEPRAPLGGRYAYLTCGWLFSEIVRGVTGMRIDEYVRASFIRKLGLQNEMFFPLPKTRAVARRRDSEVALKSTTARTSSSTTVQHDVSPSESPQVTLIDTASTSPQKAKRLELPDIVIAPPPSPHSGELRKGSSLTASGAQERTSSPAYHDVWTFEIGLDDILQQQSDFFRQMECRSPSSNDQTTSPPTSRSSYDTPDPYNHKLISPRSDFSDTGVDTVSPWLAGQQLRRLGSPNSNCPADATEKRSEAAGAPQPSLVFPKWNVSGRRHRIDLQSRLVSSRRQIGVPRISNEEVNAKLEQVQRYAVTLGTGLLNKYPSKYIHKIAARQSALRSGKLADERCSAVELARAKPHVLDPLVYDSRRIHNALIPPTNCRATARAMARFYSAVGSGRLIRPETLAMAAQPALVDTSLESLILTGGCSRLWGLGYQLFPCLRRSDKKTKPTFNTSESPSRRVTFSEPSPPSPLVSGNQQLIIGLGHGDLGGSVAFCIPQLNLSIAVLVNDILSGPLASREIVSFILECFDLEPAWTLRYTLDNLLHDLDATVKSYALSHTTPATVILKKESDLFTKE